MIARQTIHLTLTLPSTHKGESFNVADATYPTSWETDWPDLCAYFGLKGTPPPKENPNEVRSYIKSNMSVWEGIEREKGLVTGIADSERTYKGFEYFLMTLL